MMPSAATDEGRWFDRERLLEMRKTTSPLNTGFGEQATPCALSATAEKRDVTSESRKAAPARTIETARSETKLCAF